MSVRFELRPRPKHRLQSFASMNLLIVIDITGADVRTVMAPEWDDPIVEAVSTRQFSSNGMHVGRVMLSFGVDVEY